MGWTFTKLSRDLVNASVWNLNDACRIIWITLLVLKDENGEVHASLGGLAHQARKSIEETKAAIEIFLAPDPDSSRKEHEGRRIEVIPGGWRILNHKFYTDKGASDELRERWREDKARQRHKLSVENEAKDKPTQKTEPEVFSRPTISEVKARAGIIGLPDSEAESFWNYYEAAGWCMSGGKHIADWRPLLTNWKVKWETNRKPSNSTTAQHEDKLTPYSIKLKLDAIQKELIATEFSKTQPAVAEKRKKLFEEKRRLNQMLTGVK